MVKRMTKSVRVKGGYGLIMSIFTPYRVRIYAYNSQIRDTGYYLKPVHMVYKKLEGRKVKYMYFGRYWYRVYRAREGGRSKIKWIYVGRDKPDPQLPEPPINPLEGIAVIVDGDDVLVDEKAFNALTQITQALKKMGLLEI